MAITPFGGGAYGAILARYSLEQGAEAGSARRILLVDPQHALPVQMRGLAGARVHVAGASCLSAALLAEVAPDVVLMPLMARGADVFDLAGRLVALGYCGPIRAYSAPLPNARLIGDEVRARFPCLDFGLIELPEKP